MSLRLGVIRRPLEFFSPEELVSTSRLDMHIITLLILELLTLCIAINKRIIHMSNLLRYVLPVTLSVLQVVFRCMVSKAELDHQILIVLIAES